MSSHRKQVAIFGGGIAGLTAAHELIERGFAVEVYERRPPSGPDELEGVPCALGGMARTQWARVSRDEPFLNPPVPSNKEAIPLLRALDAPVEPGNPVPRLRVLFQANSWNQTEIDPDPAIVLDEVAKFLKDHPHVEKLEIRGYLGPTERGAGRLADVSLGNWQTWKFKTTGGRRAKHIAKLLVAAPYNIAPERLVPMGLGVGYPDDWSMLGIERRHVRFQVRENWLPGEHGFRYFPAYYRNVFDTMRRIPLHDEHQQAFHELPRTVLDNLVPTPILAFSTSDTPTPFPYQSKPPVSLQGIFDQLVGMLRATNGSLSDLRHFQVKMFKFMTSCRKRRDGYASQSWFDFLEAWRMSAGFRKHLDGGGEVLVSMQARLCDARSYGSASVQVLATALDPQGGTDATLNAPTSIAWFDPWRRYLESQGVVFHQGELREIRWLDKDNAWPIVETGGISVMLARDYYVLALGPADLQDIVQRSALEGPDCDRIREFPLGDPGSPKTGGALEHMSGIQFYFPSDFRGVNGHIMFPESDFRLSGIFQPQFWMQKRGWWSGYRGVLSIDISNWHRGSTWAWDLSKEELAKEVLRQVQDAFKTTAGSAAALTGAFGFAYARRITVPTPSYFHVDQDMLYEPRSATDTVRRPFRNLSPYLICRPGEYDARPGKPGEYSLQNGNFVFAGTLMQTHMRLTTMESANESGRHAVNAILRKEDFVGDECTVFDLEEYEPADLLLLKRIDEELCRLGLPHLVDMLDLHGDEPECVVREEPGPGTPTPHPDGPVLDIPPA